MRKFNTWRFTENYGKTLVLGISTFLTAAFAATGQTVLINPALEGGFELGPSFAANGWTVANAPATNQWYVGTVASGMTNNSAYVSADAGVTNGYTNTSASVTHFYRDVTFPAGETAIGLNFNWKSNGESGFWDALIVSIAPTSFTPTGSTTSLGTGVLPAPAVELGRFWLQTTTQSATIQIPPSLIGNCTASSTMRLIFTWKNDGSGGTSPSAAVDNIQLVSNINSITSAGGTFTIDNTLPLSATNFPSFTSAIAALNGAGPCLLNPVVFNVAAGQTFNELPPVITASGTLSAPITFQKNGVGTNPIIVSTGTTGTNDGSIVISGGDYFTFDGIDIDNSASNSMEYGYIIRNFTATDGAKNNIIRNASVRMNRTVTTSTSAAFLISTTTTGGGVAATSAAGSNDNNQLRNLTINGAINGISFLGTAAFPDLNNQIGVIGLLRNSITNIGPVGPTFVGARGINFSNQSGSTIVNSDISSVTSNQAAAQGIFLTGCLGNTVVSGNSIYAVSNQGSTTSTSIAYGIQAQNATTGTNVLRVSNNMIGNIFTAFTGTATATRYAIGIHVGAAGATNAQSYEVYHNTVSIGNGLTPTYSNTCFEIQNVSAVYKVQNNLFANFTGAQGATARHYTWVTTSATNFGAAGSISNNNDLYVANDVNVSGFVARANTTNIATIAAWTAAITAIPGTDQNSFSGAPVFVNNNSDLHLNMGVTPTQIESSGNTGLGVSTDFDGQNRPGPTGSVNGGATAPDAGADEFDGSPLSPPTITLNTVTPSTTPQCSATPRLVSVNVANTSGTVASVSIAYSFNGVAQGSFPMTNTSGTTWEATIPAATPANATVAWAVVATNSFALNSTFTGTAYSDEPQLGVTATATATPATICAGSSTTLQALASKTGTATVGSGTTVSGNTIAQNPFYGGYGGVKTQYLIRASELTAAGLVAGNITSLSMTITSAGASLSGFAINMEATALNVLTNNIETVNNQVFSTATFVPTVGVVSFPFSSAFAWDGTSNVIVSICWSNNNTSNTVSNLLVSTTSFVSGVARAADSRTPAEICGYTGNVAPGGWTTTTGTVSSRPIFNFAGVLSAPISSISWLDGVSTVGTSNPQIVTASTTTTYTANIQVGGCAIATAPTTTVTVNPLPTAPTATNSTQCGNAVPTASVTSTSGLPTPTFIWYSAAVAGTALQTNTSNTYTTAISSTTTFYVAELNTVTGCESARTAVTVTVATADNISASANNATICIGSSVDLSVINANPTPVQSYTYTWTNAQTGSGLTSVTGANQTVTPTQPGTYTYNVAGVDGGCNALSSVVVTVDPFAATLTPINITCNGYNDGSFSVATTTCGSAPFSYIVDGGALTSTIPTNLTPGTHTVIVQNAAGFQTSVINVTITQPTTVISAPAGTNASVCQNAASAAVSATSTVSAQTLVIPFTVSAQPTEVSSSTVPATVAASPNVFATAVMPALPAGSTITGATLNYNGIQATGSSWQSDVRLGLTGAINLNYTQGTGAAGSAGTFNYVVTIPVGGVSATGGTVDLNYFDFFNDNGGSEATFPTGSNVASITITYTPPATVSWWTAATGGTLIGTGSPFETVGTTVVPNTNTPGVYTVYAQGDFSGCANLTRTPVTVTVRPISTSTTNITACATYTWTNGTTYTSSGTYTQTLVNSVGCDSIATLNLTINQPSASTQNATACVTYTWPVNGTTYTTSGSYTHTLAGANAVGCDSTITLNLTINQPTSATQTVSACVTYTWPVNGTTYTTSGSYTHTLVGANANGCDSTITLNLTINQPTTGTDVQTACVSYTWIDGITYTTSNNTATFTIVGGAANGCDSVVTLDFTINQPTTGTDVQTACGTYTWIDGITYTSSNNTATFTIVGGASNGCDSVVTLDLTINQPATGTDVQTACGTFTWIDGITYTSSNNTATFTFVAGAANGCDSVVTLDLTINQPATGTDVQSACDTYTWIDGNTYTSSNNTATFTIAGGAANGCDSVVTLNLTITTTPTATATDNGDATITASSGATYQWIDCGTGLAIAGETGQTLTVAANGSYAVVVSNGSCADTSACVLIDYIGIKELVESAVQLMPNPTRENVTITMSVASATLEVRDAQGKLMVAKAITSGEQVDLSQAEVGVYFFTIKTTNGSVVKRVVKN